MLGLLECMKQIEGAFSIYIAFRF